MQPSKPVNKVADEAEADIRRTVTRHYAQLSELETLRASVEHWSQRAIGAEGEVSQLSASLIRAEAELTKLRDAVAAMRTHFETGAQAWLGAYDMLRALKETAAHPAIEPEKFLKALEAPKQGEPKR